jgi:hypothetical protein
LVGDERVKLKGGQFLGDQSNLLVDSLLNEMSPHAGTQEHQRFWIHFRCGVVLAHQGADEAGGASGQVVDKKANVVTLSIIDRALDCFANAQTHWDNSESRIVEEAYAGMAICDLAVMKGVMLRRKCELVVEESVARILWLESLRVLTDARNLLDWQRSKVSEPLSIDQYHLLRLRTEAAVAYLACVGVKRSIVPDRIMSSCEEHISNCLEDILEALRMAGDETELTRSCAMVVHSLQELMGYLLFGENSRSGLTTCVQRLDLNALKVLDVLFELSDVELLRGTWVKDQPVTWSHRRAKRVVRDMSERMMDIAAFGEYRFDRAFERQLAERVMKYESVQSRARQVRSSR